MIARNAGYAQTTYIDREADLNSFIRRVQIDGRHIDSRYGPCVELTGAQFRCKAGTLFERKGMNWSLGWMEMVQLLGRVYDPDALIRVAPKATHELFTPKMAYGPRLQGVSRVIDALVKDPDTRQAVIFIGKPEDGPTSDLPCTLTMQFLWRDWKLNAFVSMRSWDLCRGLPYDLMMFSGLLKVVARCIGVPSGDITVTAGSAHIYMDQLEKIPKLSKTSWKFDLDAPNSWFSFGDWAKENVASLEKGGTPTNIEYIQQL